MIGCIIIRGPRAVASYRTHVPEIGEVDGFICNLCGNKAREHTQVSQANFR